MVKNITGIAGVSPGAAQESMGHGREHDWDRRRLAPLPSFGATQESMRHGREPDWDRRRLAGRNLDLRPVDAGEMATPSLTHGSAKLLAPISLVIAEHRQAGGKDGDGDGQGEQDDGNGAFDVSTAAGEHRRQDAALAEGEGYDRFRLHFADISLGWRTDLRIGFQPYKAIGKAGEARKDREG